MEYIKVTETIASSDLAHNSVVLKDHQIGDGASEIRTM